ncbi:MAG: Crp/Fnr family transcriptional regulator [Acidobacteriota bacterium]
MKVAAGLKVQHKCLECTFRGEKFFCNIPEEQLHEFEKIKISTAFRKHGTMFIEGQPSTGIHLLCQGRVKLSTNSRSGKALILRIAEPGEILGLSAALSDGLHEATAEAIEDCQVNFVRRDEFIRFIKNNPAAAFSAIEQLNHKYHTAYAQVRSLGLSACVADKLAALMLGWASHVPSLNGDVHINVPFSHEEIGEMIGTSRETITRLLKDFRDRELITLKRSDLHILDKHLLEASIGTR